MSKPKKPSITPKAIEPDPWSAKAKIKKRINEVQEEDPVGT